MLDNDDWHSIELALSSIPTWFPETLEKVKAIRAGGVRVEKKETFAKVYVTVEHYSISATEEIEDALIIRTKKGKVRLFAPDLQKAARRAAASVSVTLDRLERADVDTGVEVSQPPVGTDTEPPFPGADALPADVSDLPGVSENEMGSCKCPGRAFGGHLEGCPYREARPFA